MKYAHEIPVWLETVEKVIHDKKIKEIKMKS